MNARNTATIERITTYIEKYVLTWARNAKDPETVKSYEMQAFGAIQFVLYAPDGDTEDLYEVLAKKWGEEWQPLFWEIAINLPEPEPKNKNSWRLG